MSESAESPSAGRAAAGVRPSIDSDVRLVRIEGQASQTWSNSNYCLL
jgi:hypothetical protein